MNTSEDTVALGKYLDDTYPNMSLETETLLRYFFNKYKAGEIKETDWVDTGYGHRTTVKSYFAEHGIHCIPKDIDQYLNKILAPLNHQDPN